MYRNEGRILYTQKIQNVASQKGHKKFISIKSNFFFHKIFLLVNVIVEKIFIVLLFPLQKREKKKKRKKFLLIKNSMKKFCAQFHHFCLVCCWWQKPALWGMFELRSYDGNMTEIPKKEKIDGGAHFKFIISVIKCRKHRRFVSMWMWHFHKLKLLKWTSTIKFKKLSCLLLSFFILFTHNTAKSSSLLLLPLFFSLS